MTFTAYLVLGIISHPLADHLTRDECTTYGSQVGHSAVTIGGQRTWEQEPFIVLCVPEFKR